MIGLGRKNRTYDRKISQARGAGLVWPASLGLGVASFHGTIDMDVVFQKWLTGLSRLIHPKKKQDPHQIAGRKFVPKLDALETRIGLITDLGLPLPDMLFDLSDNYFSDSSGAESETLPAVIPPTSQLGSVEPRVVLPSHLIDASIGGIDMGTKTTGGSVGSGGSSGSLSGSPHYWPTTPDTTNPSPMNEGIGAAPSTYATRFSVVILPELDAGQASQKLPLAISELNAGTVKGIKLEITAINQLGGIEHSADEIHFAGQQTIIYSLRSAQFADAQVLRIRATELYDGMQPAFEKIIFRQDLHATSDAALFVSFRATNCNYSFATLTERYSALIKQTCQSIVGNQCDVDDLHQRVMIKLARYDGAVPDHFAGWLRVVARNLSITHLRSKARRLFHERAAANITSASLTSTAVPQALTDVESSLRKLPVPLQQAVRLRYLEGRSQKEIAQILGCPRGTVSQRAARGIQVLRKMMRSKHAKR